RETQRPRLLLPLPYFVASFIAMGGDLQALVMPPMLTSDQLKLLRLDNVVPAGEPGFEAFGLQPRSVEVVVPTYLWRYRDGGQFAPKTA
ncbi:MAG: complex I NDUFA9 subunit family protein, partial [Asticcacaulis sp.]